MAKIFDLRSFRNSRKGQSSSRNNPEHARKSGSPVQPIDGGKRGVLASWAPSSSRISVNAGAGLLLATGVLCGLFLSGHEKKSAGANFQADENIPSRTAAGLSASARPIPKPSPSVPADKKRAGESAPWKQAPTAVPAPPAVPKLAVVPAVPRYTPVRFEATHKKVFGGCRGLLELTSSRLHFSCPNQSDLNFPVESIEKAHKDGVVLKTGEKYHFVIANHSKEQVGAIFVSWLNRVQQFPQQTSRVAAF